MEPSSALETSSPSASLFRSVEADFVVCNAEDSVVVLVLDPCVNLLLATVRVDKDKIPLGEGSDLGVRDG